METPKTKSFMDILNKLKVGDKKIMYVSAEYDDNVDRSLRNIPSVLGVLLSDINTYDLMNSDVLVLSESAAKIFSEDESGTEATKCNETTARLPKKAPAKKTKKDIKIKKDETF